MSAKKLKSVGLIIGAIVLAFAGFWLLLTSTQPGVVQGQDSWPTLIPPDLTVAAEFANMPPCCGDDPAPTGVAETAFAIQTQIAIPPAETPTPEILPPIYLTPSDEWITYTDRKDGYSFDYPANFTVLPPEFGGETHIMNHPYDGRAYNEFDSEGVSVAINVLDNKAEGETLVAYANRFGPDPSRWKTMEQTNIELAQGYSGIKRVDQLQALEHQKVIAVFVEWKGLVYVISTYDSNHKWVFEKLLDTLVLP